MMSLISFPWRIGAIAALLAVVCASGIGYRAHVWQQGYNKAVAERAELDNRAIAIRIKDNGLAVAKNESINETITKVKDETLAPVIRTIYVDRVRIGPSICAAAGTAKADDAASGDTGDSRARLVPPAFEEAARELDAEVEKHLATGRACQDWGKAHGFMP